MTDSTPFCLNIPYFGCYTADSTGTIMVLDHYPINLSLWVIILVDFSVPIFSKCICHMLVGYLCFLTHRYWFSFVEIRIWGWSYADKNGSHNSPKVPTDRVPKMEATLEAIVYCLLWRTFRQYSGKSTELYLVWTYGLCYCGGACDDLLICIFASVKTVSFYMEYMKIIVLESSPPASFAYYIQTTDHLNRNSSYIIPHCFLWFWRFYMYFSVFNPSP